MPIDIGLRFDNSTGGGSSAGHGGVWGCGGTAGLSGVSGGSAATLPYYNTAPNKVITFKASSIPNQYETNGFNLQTLAYDPGSSSYSMLEPSGAIRKFSGTGQIQSVADASGNLKSYTYDGIGNLQSISTTLDDGTNQSDFTWSGGKITEVIYSVNSRAVLKTSYAYSGDNLVTVKTRENTAASGSPVWSNPISSTRYSYHSGTSQIRHVVPPEQYRQMVNNGIDPDTATESQLDDYASTEYQYSGDRVSLMYKIGRRYTYTFAYSFNYPGGTSLNVWTSKTDVTVPDGSLRTYYYNSRNQLLLKKVSDSVSTPTKIWYPLYQRFEEVSGRILLSAEASAINTVSESDPNLVTLKSSAGKITVYTYTAEGRSESIGLKQGEGADVFLLKSWTYEARTLSGIGTIYVPATETVYRNDDSTGGITTTFTNDWHLDTLQLSKKTTTLPVVSTSENGRGATVTTESHYNSRGFLIKSVDQRGTATTYAYDQARGGMTQMIQDQGSGKLNLTTDYTLDDRGRTILTLGPLHSVDLAGTSTSLRTASWTYFRDSEDGRWTFSGYRTAAGADQIVGPVTIVQSNIAPPSGGSYTGWRQSSTYDAPYTASGGVGIPAPTATFAQSTWVRWKISLFDKSAELKEQWTYFTIPASGYGAQTTNYGKKLFAYDSAGRENQTTCAGATIDKTTFNAMSWPVTEELGTSAGLTVTRTNQYDDNGNLTKITLPVDGTSGNDRVTDLRYDWRDRQIEQETTVEKDGGGTWTLITKSVYDNRNLVTATTSYHTSVATGNRTAYQTMAYDVLGRRYQTLVYAVSSAGATATPQTSNVYYEAGNQVVRNAPSGSALFTANVFDAIGRTTTSYQAYEPSGYTPGSDPASVVNAVVMEQQEMDWDAASNLLSTTSRQRFDTATGNGALGTPSSSEPKARVSYVASYSDSIGRSLATANYGTNGATSPWPRSATVPARSDTILVTSTTYDAAGNAVTVTDPIGAIVTRTFDKSDRLTTVVENSSGSGSAVRTTRYEYTDDGWLTKLKSDNATTGQQTTEWIRGVTTAQGSALNSNRLVYQKAFAGSTGSSDRVTYKYNRQLQVTTMTDENGTVHAYAYDKLGRLLSDSVTTFGTGIDSTVGKLQTGHNERGLVIRSTSTNAAGSTVINEIKSVYNDFNQLITEYQEHAGAVNTSTSLKVQYSYASGSANTVRTTGITYPNGTTITTDYVSSLSSAISRTDAIKESSTTLATFRYLGIGTLIGQKYDGASNADLTMENGGTGDAGDKYTGLDRFGRLVETIWKTSSNSLVNTTYGRNRVGGVVWQNNVKAHSLSVATQDNYYWYDGLQQVTRHDRGDLTPTSGPPYTGIDPSSRQQQEDFTFDETGNWTQLQTQSPTLVQSRTHDQANQIVSLTNPSSVIQPVYDATGNMTTMPKASAWTTSNTLQWDAWNRLVSITDGSSPIYYNYDALSRRTIKIHRSTREIRQYYYDRQWRAVEERVSGASITVDRQYTWSPIDRWTLIRRKRTTSGISLGETRFVLKDYLDPAAIIDTSATVDERFGYDAFGQLNLMTPTFAARTTSVCDWNFLFHAEFLDSDSSLYNYGYRYYHTNLGRWLSRDPIGEEGGLNLYWFVGNNGIMNLDVLGEKILRSYDICDDPTYSTLPEERSRPVASIFAYMQYPDKNCSGKAKIFVVIYGRKGTNTDVGYLKPLGIEATNEYTDLFGNTRSAPVPMKYGEVVTLERGPFQGTQIENKESGAYAQLEIPLGCGGSPQNKCCNVDITGKIVLGMKGTGRAGYNGQWVHAVVDYRIRLKKSLYSTIIGECNYDLDQSKLDVNVYGPHNKGYAR